MNHRTMDTRRTVEHRVLNIEHVSEKFTLVIAQLRKRQRK